MESELTAISQVSGHEKCRFLWAAVTDCFYCKAVNRRGGADVEAPGAFES